MRGIELVDGWLFQLGEQDGAHLNSFDDCNWRNLRLPHDWSVEFSFDEEKGEGCTAYLLGGFGWYRKHLETTKEMTEGKTILQFDGIYSRAQVYCNGQVLAFHPNGYTPLLVDVTDYLKPVGEDNVIAVSVDHTRYADSRWYTGSGIYRKVSMHVLPKTHIPVWGIYVTTPEITSDFAEVNTEIKVERVDSTPIDVIVEIKDQEENIVAKVSKELTFEVKGESLVSVSCNIENPKLWDVNAPYHYQCHVKLLSEGQLLHEDQVRFGVRTIQFDPLKGFELNGKKTLIKGVCLHHDAGLVGGAVPLDVWRRRLNILSEAGCNAIRTAHNPASEDFLDLCDDMGFLVQEEFFDDWDNPKDKRLNQWEREVDYITRSYTEFFHEYGKSDLFSVALRDRNHPCIIQWSIGNEIEWTYPKYNGISGYFGMNASGNYFYNMPPFDIEKTRANAALIPEDYYDVGKTARMLTDWTKSLDTTRPVTANCILPSVSYESGFTDALDIVGTSYRGIMYDYLIKHYPDKPIMGTENVPQYHEWKSVLDNPHIAGIFLWTGFDYMGEAHRYQWPQKGSGAGLVDIGGFVKPAYNLFKSLWQDKPTLALYTNRLENSLCVEEEGKAVLKEADGWKRRNWRWHPLFSHWNYENRDKIVVEAYSNCDSIAMYLNDELIGEQEKNHYGDQAFKWLVPYADGELKAVGVKDGEEIISYINTTGPIASIELSVDKKEIKVDTDSAAHIVAQFKDAKGNDVKILNDEIVFEVSAGGKLLGVDNGSLMNVDDFQSDRVTTHEGHCLTILQALKVEPIVVRAIAPTQGLQSEEIVINVVV